MANFFSATIYILILSVIGLFGLTGCITDPTSGWSERYGPDTSLPSDQIDKSTDNQIAIMTALAKVSPGSNGRVDMYLLTLAGFNFVDEQCDAYLHELFVIDEERDRIKAGFNSAGLLTNAILAVSPASKASMAIVAQAFGIRRVHRYDSKPYLYGVHPSTILGVVTKLQAAYRDQTETDKTKINSEPAAYARIRGYLQLCLPPMI